eukprot:Colp12_sorted_trinity150504_noHs@23243
MFKGMFSRGAPPTAPREDDMLIQQEHLNVDDHSHSHGHFHDIAEQSHEHIAAHHYEPISAPSGYSAPVSYDYESDPVSPSAYDSMSIDPALMSPFATSEGIDYVFASDRKRASFSEQICYGTGTTYLLGLSTGGAWGLYEGLRKPQGESFKLKVNGVLNSLTRRGPFVGNASGCLALMFNMIDGGIVMLRDGQDDVVNNVAAGALSGFVFKSTAGPRRMVIASILGAAVGGTFSLVRFVYENGRLPSLDF